VANTPGWESPEPARQRRAALIERFKKRQRNSRKWINFAEIAESYSREDHSILPNEHKRAAAFDLLADDLLAGEFEENGHSLILFLHPATKKMRWTPAELKVAFDSLDRDHVRSEYLAHCWILQRLFKHWLERHNLEFPRRFEPLNKGTTQLRGRPQRPRERRKPDRERAQLALEKLYPDGLPDQATVPNKTLFRQVSEKLKHLKLPGVSDDTILRAAGRR